jgi:hypothetical protein
MMTDNMPDLSFSLQASQDKKLLGNSRNCLSNFRATTRARFQAASSLKVKENQFAPLKQRELRPF